MTASPASSPSAPAPPTAPVPQPTDLHMSATRAQSRSWPPAAARPAWEKSLRSARPAGRAGVGRRAGLRLPQPDLDHGEALAGGVLEDEPGDVLGRGVDVEHVHRL